MERSEFFARSTPVLEHIEAVLGDLEHPGVDVDLAGDVLTIEFGDGEQFILNAHSAANQIWLAAGRTAWHFDFELDGSRWIARKNGDELMTTVARVVGDKLDADIEL